MKPVRACGVQLGNRQPPINIITYEIYSHVNLESHFKIESIDCLWIKSPPNDALAEESQLLLQMLQSLSTQLWHQLVSQ